MVKPIVTDMVQISYVADIYPILLTSYADSYGKEKVVANLEEAFIR